MTKRKPGSALEEATVKAMALIGSSIKESLAITEIVADKVRTAGTDISSLSHRQDSHEKVCAERMGNLNEKMIALASSIALMAKSAEERFTKINASILTGAIALSVAAVGAVISLILFIFVHFVK